MSKQKTYAEIIEELKSNHFYPGLITEVTVKKETVIGLWIYCSPILRDDRLSRVREIIGEGFVVDFDPNKQQIEISKKKLS